MKVIQNMKPELIDFHCHLDLYPNHISLIADCDKNKIATLAVTTTPKAWTRNRELTESSPLVRAALGLHPQLILDRSNEISLFEKYLPEARYIGEIGLDAGPRFYRSFDEQQRIFERILRACSEQGNKVLSIHSTRAATKVLQQLERNLRNEKCHSVLHWFTGGVKDATHAIDLGCYFSINSEMLRSPKHRSLIKTLPINRILTETDGPFVEFNGRAIRPADVVGVVSELALLYGINQDTMKQTLVENLKHITTF